MRRYGCLLKIAMLIGLCQAASVAAQQVDCNPARQWPGVAGEKVVVNQNMERTYQNDFFARQQPVLAVSRDWRVALRGATPCRKCPNGVAFNFEVRSLKSNKVTSFRISSGASRINAVGIVNRSRAVVLGRASSNVAMVMTVELPSGALVDQFECGGPSLSPDSRFVAFNPIEPVHPPPGVVFSMAYLAYDLSRGPRFNRPQAATEGTSPFGVVGWPIYGEGEGAPAAERAAGRGATQAHQMFSMGFYWVGKTDQVAFADLHGTLCNLVVASLEDGVRNPRVREIPLCIKQIVDLPRCAAISSAMDFRKIQNNPADLVFVNQIGIVAARPGVLRLSLAPHPCLRTPEVDVLLAPEKERRAGLGKSR